MAQVWSLAWNSCMPQAWPKKKKKEEEKAGGLIHPDFKLCYKTVVIKTVCSWHKIDTEINTTEEIESPGLNPLLSGQLMYNNGAKNIQWKKDSLFNKWYWENWTTFLCHMQNVNSKWIKDLNVKLYSNKLKKKKTKKHETWNHRTPRRKNTLYCF